MLGSSSDLTAARGSLNCSETAEWLPEVQGGMSPSSEMSRRQSGDFNVDLSNNRRNVHCGATKVSAEISPDQQIMLSDSFPDRSFDVKSRMAANPFSENSSNGHYVSEPYEISENRDEIFSSGQYSSIESLHPIASTAIYRTAFLERVTSTMNAQIPHDTWDTRAYLSLPSLSHRDIYYHPLENTSENFEPMSDRLLPQRMMTEEYPPLPEPGFYHNDGVARLYTSCPEGPSSTNNALFLPEFRNALIEGEMDSQLCGAPFVSSGVEPIYPSGSYDFNLGFARLQERRSVDSRFYQPDPRITVDLDVSTVRPIESPRKQGLACHFCRERKIACGRPMPGSQDATCSQCARRNIRCTYPTESRRGQHKRKAQKARDPKLSLR